MENVAGNTKLHDVTAVHMDMLINCSGIVLLIYVFFVWLA